MNHLATMALDLLCTITFPPAGGHQPEDLAAIEQAWWQTLIYELEPTERKQIEEAAKQEVESLRERPASSLSPEAKTKLATLEAFLRGDLA